MFTEISPRYDLLIIFCRLSSTASGGPALQSFFDVFLTGSSGTRLFGNGRLAIARRAESTVTLQRGPARAVELKRQKMMSKS